MPKEKPIRVKLVFHIGSRFREVAVRVVRSRLQEQLPGLIRQHARDKEGYTGALYRGGWID